MPPRTVDAVMLEAHAASFAERAIADEGELNALSLALSMLDLTTLEGKDSPEKVRSICRKAIGFSEREFDPPLPHAAAVCVYPALVSIAKEALAGSGVKVASVATGFPSGQYPLAVRLNDVRRAVHAGADEIDMVINRGAFLAGRLDVVADEIRQVKQACEDATLKIILETGELETYDNIRRAADLAIEAASSFPAGRQRSRTVHLRDGEVFIKTSTGKIAPAATPPGVLVMLQAIDDHFRATGVRIGMKPAGGIRTAKQAMQYLIMVKETLGEAWLTPELFRFGASTLANDLVRAIWRRRTGREPAAYELSEA
ncbi:MAG: deoxyribose-phosphate aldolase [Planctomycetota bacterium]|nr:deoxyribose-phosphate aldolase [Planctomycetota bacterium]